MADAVMVRTSERGQFKRCRWAWDRGFNDRVKPHTAAPALRFGTLVHASLANFYRPGVKRGPKPAVTFKRLYRKELREQEAFGFRDDDGKWQDAGDLGVDMLTHYWEHYGADTLWQVIATEQPFEVPVYTEAQERRAEAKGKSHEELCHEPLFYYVGVMDGIWRNRETKRLWIPDHKTTGKDPTNVRHLALDEQAGAYWTYGVDWLKAKGILKDEEKLEGMLYNFLRKAERDTRPQNEAGLYLNQDKSVSKNQPAPWFFRHDEHRNPTNRRRVRERVRQEAREMRLVRAGKLEAYKNPSVFNCAGCGYRDICELHEAGADWEEMAKHTMAPWDPYAEHELFNRS